MRRVLLHSLIPVLALVGLSCDGMSSESEEAVDREEIQATLDAYLPLLAQAYSTGDFSQLEPFAAQKEVSSVHKRVQDLALQGRRLEATLRSVTIEDVNSWNYSNAYVTTHEVWDLVVHATGTDQVLAEEYEQPNRVKYQLKRVEDSWRILFRQIQE